MDMPPVNGWTALETLGIRGLAERVYLALLTRRMATATEVASLLQISQSQVQQSLAHIEHKGLASHTPNIPRVYIAVEPNFAIDALMKQRQMALEQVRAALPALAGKSTPDVIDHERQPILETITSIEHLKSLIAQLYKSFQSEIMMFRRAPILIPSMQEDDRSPAGIRTVSDQTFLDVPGALTLLRESVVRGAQSRTISKLPFKMMIVDRAVAVIALDDEHSPEMTPRFLLHRCALLDALCLLFESVWEQAAPVVAAPKGSSGEPCRGEHPAGSPDSVIPLLAAGLNDKAIAQELHISASTLNRRLADLMSAFGAKTRFQLGMQVALRASPPPSPMAPAHAG